MLVILTAMVKHHPYFYWYSMKFNTSSSTWVSPISMFLRHCVCYWWIRTVWCWVFLRISAFWLQQHRHHQCMSFYERDCYVNCIHSNDANVRKYYVWLATQADVVLKQTEVDFYRTHQTPFIYAYHKIHFMQPLSRASMLMLEAYLNNCAVYLKTKQKKETKLLYSNYYNTLRTYSSEDMTNNDLPRAQMHIKLFGRFFHSVWMEFHQDCCFCYSCCCC